MEKPGYVIIHSRKGWWLMAAVLSCLLIILLTKINQPMTSTQSVQGHLYRASTGQPVEGAMIMIAEGPEHPDIGSQSDEQGIFYLSNIKVPGTYTLLIHYNEQSKTVTVNITAGGGLKIPL